MKFSPKEKPSSPSTTAACEVKGIRREKEKHVWILHLLALCWRIVRVGLLLQKVSDLWRPHVLISTNWEQITEHHLEYLYFTLNTHLKFNASNIYASNYIMHQQCPLFPPKDWTLQLQLIIVSPHEMAASCQIPVHGSNDRLVQTWCVLAV